MTESRHIPGKPDRNERITKCLEDNPDLTEALIEEILIGMEELERGEIAEYSFR